MVEGVGKWERGGEWKWVEWWWWGVGRVSLRRVMSVQTRIQRSVSIGIVQRAIRTNRADIVSD
jgi:hypothetical protein